MRSLRQTSRPISSRNNFAAQARGKPGIRAGLFLCRAPEQCRRECARSGSRAVRRVGLRIVDSNRNEREQEQRQQSAHGSQVDAPTSDHSLVLRVEMPHVEGHEDRVLHRNLHPRQLLRPRGAMRPWLTPGIAALFGRREPLPGRVISEKNPGLGIEDQMPVPRPFDGSLSPPRLVKACEKSAKARARANRHGAGDRGQTPGRDWEAISRAATGNSGFALAGHCTFSHLRGCRRKTTAQSACVTVGAMAMQNLERGRRRLGEKRTYQFF